MGELKDRLKGLTNEGIGNVKQGFAKLTDNPELEAEGVLQERKGEAQQLEGKVKGKLGDKI